MRQSCLTSLLISVIVMMPCATALGQLSDAGPAPCLACDQATPTDCGSCCDFQSPCHKCLQSREYLFDDWHGLRPCLAKHGVIADLQLT